MPTEIKTNMIGIDTETEATAAAPTRPTQNASII